MACSHLFVEEAWHRIVGLAKPSSGLNADVRIAPNGPDGAHHEADQFDATSGVPSAHVKTPPFAVSFASCRIDARLTQKRQVDRSDSGKPRPFNGMRGAERAAMPRPAEAA